MELGLAYVIHVRLILVYHHTFFLTLSSCVLLFHLVCQTLRSRHPEKFARFHETSKPSVIDGFLNREFSPLLELLCFDEVVAVSVIPDFTHN